MEVFLTFGTSKNLGSVELRTNEILSSLKGLNAAAMFRVLFIWTSFHRFVAAILLSGTLLFKPKLNLKILYGYNLFAHTCIVHTLVLKVDWQEIRKTMTLGYT